MIKKAPEHPSSLYRLKKGSLLQLAIIIIALIVLIPQFQQFSSSWSTIASAQPAWLALGAAGVIGTIIFATLVYMSLVPKKIPFGRTALIQSATYFTNRLLPSGLGGIGFNALYLVRQSKMSRTDAAVYATANNLVGFVAFAISIALIIFFGEGSNIKIGLPDRKYLIGGAVICILLLIFIIVQRSFQKRIFDTVGHLLGVLLTIIRHPKRLVSSVILSMGITASYMLILYAATRSIGLSVPLVDLFLAFVAGNTALTVSPTPGGLGAVEAATIAVLISSGTEPGLALAGVVIFRLLSYWLPIIPGYLAFRRATTKKYV